jgi:hypothetical protein
MTDALNTLFCMDFVRIMYRLSTDCLKGAGAEKLYTLQKQEEFL